MKRISALTLLVAATVVAGSFAAPASAAVPKDEYPAWYTSRPLTLSSGMGQVGLDLTLGLNSGRAAKDIGLGLNFGYGIISKLEIGTDIMALSYGKDAQGAKFGSAAIYLKYEALEWLAVYFDVHFPGGGLPYVDSFGDQLVGIRVGTDLKYEIVKNLLDVHGSVGLDMGFAKDTVAGAMPQIALALKYGIAIAPIKQLYIDLTAETIMCFRPSAGSFGDRTRVPLHLTVGSPVIDPLDVFLKFSMDDLNPAAGGAADARSLMVGAAYRF